MGHRQADWKIGWFIWSGAKEGDLKVIRDMVDEGADINYKYNGTTPLHQAAINGHFDAVDLLCENGANVHRRDGHGDTALRHAAAFGHLDIVKFLVKKGADILHTNVSGDSALHGACAYCQPITAQFLLDSGAKCNQYSKEGNTPLHKTMVFSSWFVPENRRLETIDVLLRNGADLWLINHRGYTPREMAAERKMPKSILDKMASIENSQLNKKQMKAMKDSLECPVCLDRYRVPRTLSHCGHTYCDACLNTMLKASIQQEKNIIDGFELKCPECRFDYRLMEKSVKCFPISRKHVQAVSFYNNNDS